MAKAPKKNLDLIIGSEDGFTPKGGDKDGPIFETPEPPIVDDDNQSPPSPPIGDIVPIEPQPLNLIRLNKQPIGFVTKNLGQPLYSLDNHYMFEVFIAGRDNYGNQKYQIVKQSLEGTETIRYSPNYARTKAKNRYKLTFNLKRIVRDTTGNSKIEFNKYKQFIDSEPFDDIDETVETFFTITPEDISENFKRFSITFDTLEVGRFLFEIKATDILFVMDDLILLDLGKTPLEDGDADSDSLILVDEDEELEDDDGDTGDDGGDTDENDEDTLDLLYEQFSDTFQIEGVNIQQTLSQSFDPFGGIEYNASSLPDTLQEFRNLNIDGREPLGLFVFNSDNIISDNFPPVIGNTLFRQIQRENLVPNGSGKYIYSINNRYLGVNTSYNDTYTMFIPEGGWGYCTYDGIGTRDLTDAQYDDSLGHVFPENNTSLNGEDFVISFEQSEDFSQENLDNQNATGYAGYYPYFTIGELQKNLTNVLAGDSGDAANDFLSNLMNSGSNPYYKLFPINFKNPNYAKWVTGISGASYGRCLEFTANAFNDGFYDTDGDGDIDEQGVYFDWETSGELNGIAYNQYRTLNQVVQIYDKQNPSIELLPTSILEVKFRMKKSPGTTTGSDIEVAIVDGDGNVGSPLRIDDEVENYGYPKNFHYWPHGSFNTQTYSDGLNTPNTIDKSFSWFGGRGKFTPPDVDDVWQSYSFKFSLGDVFCYNNSSTVRDLFLLVQTTGNFFGTIYLDDFEVYESNDFLPDVDVRKKISTGNYGKADLTQYYDEDLQPEEYKDSQSPLEAQFYFYPTYPSNKIFNTERTPIYRDFREGLFYLYDVDWGDGSSKEFSNPKKIDENTAVFHTYKSSGVFQVTGYMIRIKEASNGVLLGITNTKKFRLNININEGVDEDFTYFGSADGFSFLPYKNALPIIGGYSKESVYFKSIERQLGFYALDTEIFSSGSFLNLAAYETLKPTTFYELAEANGDNQFQLLETDDYRYGQDIFDTDGDGEADTSFPVPFSGDEATANKLVELYSSTLQGSVEFQSFEISTYTTLYTLGWNEELQKWEYRIFGIDFTPGPPTPGQDNYPQILYEDNFFITDISLQQFQDVEVPLKTLIEFKNPTDKLKTEIALAKMDSNYKILFNVLPFYELERTNSEGEIINNGIKIPENQLGQGVGDINLTSMKYYTEPKSIWELFGFEDKITYTDSDEPFIPETGALFFNEGNFEILEGELQEALIGVYSFINNEQQEKMVWAAAGWVNDGFLELNLSSYQSSIENYNFQKSIRIKNFINNSIPSSKTIRFSHPTLNTLYWYEYFDDNNYSPLFQGEYIEIYPGQTVEIIIPDFLNTLATLAQDVGNPSNVRYWKNIIPKDYSIFNREGIDDTKLIPVDIYSNQDWLNELPPMGADYYYPVLPKHAENGEYVDIEYNESGNVVSGYPLVDGVYKIPFPLQAPITNEKETSDNLIINISSDLVDNNIFNDNSGNENYGFSISDYKAEFDIKTLKPKKRKNTTILNSSTIKGAF